LTGEMKKFNKISVVLPVPCQAKIIVSHSSHPILETFWMIIIPGSQSNSNIWLSEIQFKPFVRRAGKRWVLKKDG